MAAPDWLRDAVARWGAQVARDRLGVDRIASLTRLKPYQARQVAKIAKVAGYDLDGMRRVLDAWVSERERAKGVALEAAAAEPEDLEPVPGTGAEAPARPGVTVEGDDERLAVSAAGQGLVRNLDELAREAEIDLARWTDDGTFKVRTWATPMRRRRSGPEGQRLDDEVVIVRSWYAAATFRRRLDTLTSAVDWRPLRRVPRVVTPGAVPVAVLIPDMQVGYRWTDRHRTLAPLHDWAAIDAMLRWVKRVDPQFIQHLGDLLDFAAFSTKYPVPLALRDTARPAVLTVHALLRDLREKCPSAGQDVQLGNHDDRPERGTVGTEFDGLTSATAPNGPPVLSAASLLGLPALDVTWRHYGQHRWLFDRVLVHHGDVVRAKGGGTVAAVIRDASNSVVFGHVHRLEMASKTIHGPEGRRVITAATPGCLCRVDGSVPGVTQRPDWQQGVGLVWWDEARRQEHIELVPIHDGVLMWRGERIEGDGRRLADEIGSQIGWPQVGIGAEAA